MGKLLFGCLILLLVISAFFMPWVNRTRIKELRREVESLQSKVKMLELRWLGSELTAKPQAPPPVQAEHRAPIVPTPTSVNEQTPTVAKSTFEKINPPSTSTTSEMNDVNKQKQPERLSRATFSPAQKSAPIEPTRKPEISFEQQFGARLPVWIGGVALAFAGFFLVKYSIDNNLLSPAVRVILGGIFGYGLLESAKWVRSKPNLANGVRISQSLAGAGIAVLYLVSFAASRLYGLIPPFAGFVAMAGITWVALRLALRHGPPIAMLGMVGGFLTPTLMSVGTDNAFILFTYLYFILSSLLIVARKANWWWLSIPTIIASFLWVIVWLVTSSHPADSIWLGLFLIGICATIYNQGDALLNDASNAASHQRAKFELYLKYIGLGGSVVLMGLVAGKGGFAMLDWGMFGVLTLGGIALAFFNDKLYGFVPWLSMAVTAVMILSWNSHNALSVAFIITIFAIMYVACGYLLMTKSHKPLRWAGIAAGASVVYYLLAYYKLHYTMLLESIPLAWGLLALALAAGSVYALQQTKEHFSSHPQLEYLLAIFASAATAFVAFAAFIELDREFLSVAVAAEMLALAWISTKLSLKSLRPLVAVLAGVFAVVLLPQILLLTQLTVYSLVEARLNLQSSLPMVKYPLFQLGLPALMFVGAARLLRKQSDGDLIHVLEVTAVALVAVMGYYFARNMLHPDQNILFIKAGFFERGLLTNILFGYGALCLWIGRTHGRKAVLMSGLVLSGIALFRIIYFDMLIYNPRWSMQQIQGLPLLNSMLLPYGLPLVWCYLLREELMRLARHQWANYVGGFMLVSVFALVSLNVRHVYHGEFLQTGMTINAEIYTYSVAWLMLGLALLYGGITRQSKSLRYASLGMILFTIAKVFLYDASELEGLYRVFSFFGLGLCLIGLSYLYTRFVFGGKSDE